MTSGRATRLRELAGLFLRLGLTAFGGPAAHIAMMEDEAIQRRGWLKREEFLDLVVAVNLIPGPNSTEMAIHLGLRRGGWAGLVLAGACFILPAASLSALAAWAYQRYAFVPEVEVAFGAIKAAVLAIVLQALIRFAKTTLGNPGAWAIFAASCIAVLLGAGELPVLGAAGVIGVLLARKWRRPPTAALLAGAGIPTPGSLLDSAWRPLAVSAAAAVVPAKAALLPLFLSFLKIGSVLFGSGYVLLAFLRAEFVESRGWLSESQILDAVAVGQITPGPVFSTATFIGWLLAGPGGAIVATIGIFLPGFVFVAVSGPLIPRLRKSRAAGAFLDGVVAASLALMAVVSWQLGRAALVDWITIALFGASALALWKWRVNSAWIVLGAALVGLVAHAFV